MSRITVDPREFPVESVAGEPAVDIGRFSTTALRERFASPPQWVPENGQRIREGLDYKRAAVLVPLVMHPDGPTLLLTQRTAHLTQHAGQISFPGGRVEQDDVSLQATALRETQEEIGVPASAVEVLGTLPDYFTGTGYRVTPVVGLIQPPVALNPDPGEVAEVFEVPLAFLMDGMHHERRKYVSPSGVDRHTVYAMPYQEYFIWGATAGMLRNLFHFLRA